MILIECFYRDTVISLYNIVCRTSGGCSKDVCMCVRVCEDVISPGHKLYKQWGGVEVGGRRVNPPSHNQVFSTTGLYQITKVHYFRAVWHKMTNSRP